MNNTQTVELTTAHRGKMHGMQSISTSCLCNENCQKRAKDPNSICSHCYAERQLSYQKNTADKMERNSVVLSSHLLTKEELPIINASFFRFEAFGDLMNETHLLNYIKIAKANPYTHFALWTKNVWFLDNVFNKQGVKKPKNLVIVASSPVVNVELKLPEKYDKIVDKIFTVYDKKTAKTVDINCGARNCLACHRCYLKNTDKQIREILK